MKVEEREEMDEEGEVGDDGDDDDAEEEEAVIDASMNPRGLIILRSEEMNCPLSVPTLKSSRLD